MTTEDSHGRRFDAGSTSAGLRDMGRIWRLSLKELRETLRDRRTVITLLLMPVLVYPLLSIMFQRFLLSSFRAGAEVVYRIGAETEEAVDAIEAVLTRGDLLLQAAESQHSAPTDEASQQSPLGQLPGFGRGPVHLRYLQATNPEQDVAAGSIDVFVRPLHANGDAAQPPAHTWELIYAEGGPVGAVEYIQRRLRAINTEFVRGRLEELGVSTQVEAIETQHKRVPFAVGGSTFSLAAVVPLILILMTITGAVYPAIDLTAGERERGTLEALVAAPVPRLGLLIAKYAAVLVVAILTATVNLVAMTVTVYSVNLGPLLFGEQGLSASDVVQVFGLLVLFAAFFSAVLLALTSFARSFKEAQAYLIPLMLFSLAPGLLALVPGVRLTGVLAVVPLANVVLLSRDVLQGAAVPLLAVVVVLSTILYALAALGLAARIFGTDAILYGSAGSWSDLLQRPQEQRPAATVSSALFCLAIMFPAHFLLVQFLGRFADASMDVRLSIQSVLSIVVFVGIPWTLADFSGVNGRSGFGLHKAPVVAFAGAALLGLSLWAFVFELVQLSRHIPGMGLSEDLQQLSQTLREELRKVHPVWILVTLAVVPAVVEEFFFRGFLFHAFRRRNTAWQAIVYSACLFGLFHVVVRDSLLIERLIPSTLLGLVLGWVCERTGSILPGMLLHACSNGVVLMLGRFQEELESRGIGVEEVEHLPWHWLLAAGSVSVLGLAILLYGTRRAAEPEAASRATAL